MPSFWVGKQDLMDNNTKAPPVLSLPVRKENQWRGFVGAPKANANKQCQGYIVNAETLVKVVKVQGCLGSVIQRVYFRQPSQHKSKAAFQLGS